MEFGEFFVWDKPSHVAGIEADSQEGASLGGGKIFVTGKDAQVIEVC